MVGALRLLWLCKETVCVASRKCPKLMTHQPHKLSLRLQADACMGHRQSNVKQVKGILKRQCAKHYKYKNRKIEQIQNY